MLQFFKTIDCNKNAGNMTKIGNLFINANYKIRLALWNAAERTWSLHLAVLRRMSQHFNQRSEAATWQFRHGIAVRLKEMNEVRNYIRNQFGKVFAEKTRVSPERSRKHRSRKYKGCRFRIKQQFYIFWNLTRFYNLNEKPISNWADR